MCSQKWHAEMKRYLLTPSSTWPFIWTICYRNIQLRAHEQTLPELSALTEPMQLSRTRLSGTKRKRRLREQCLCPVRLDRPSRGAGVVEMPCRHVVSHNFLVLSWCFTIPVLIQHSESVFSLPVQIDTGVAGNFIDQDTSTATVL